MGSTYLYLKNIKSKYADLKAKQQNAETLNRLDDFQEEFSAEEGRELYEQHRSLERNSKLVRQAKIIRLSEDPELHCEVYNFSFVETYGEIGYGCIEAHHIVPKRICCYDPLLFF